MTPIHRHALIVGAGQGLSAALARRFASEGLAVTLAARTIDDLGDLAAETGAGVETCDAADHAAVAGLFARLDDGPRGAPDVMVYNAGARVRGAVTDLDPEAVAAAVHVTGTGGFFCAREAARRMVPQGHGALLFTGASAGVKGFAGSSCFAMGKFALRGLAQALARELQPQGVRVAHFVIDGGIANAARGMTDEADGFLDPDAIAATYWHFLSQDRSVWPWEVELRPWTERF
ncbi:MAG: SDR family NAD(P)-dependent oxidoreductase [Paracoccaceae bacterium]